MFAGAMLLGPLGQAIGGATADTNEAEKAQIAQLYQRRDVLIRLAAFKRCGVTGASERRRRRRPYEHR